MNNLYPILKYQKTDRAIFVIISAQLLQWFSSLIFRDEVSLKSGYQLQLFSNADSIRSKVPLIHDLIAHTIFKFPIPHITLTKLLGKGGLVLPKRTKTTKFWYRAKVPEQYETLSCLQRVNYFQFVQKKKLALDFLPFQNGRWDSLL